MVSAETLHVVTTELVVGTFALAGLCFGLKLLYSIKILSNDKANDALDSIAHGALLFGLLSLPFAILSGINSAGANDDGFMSAILVNKLWLSFAGFGLAVGVLLSRWKVGNEIWNESKSSLMMLRIKSVAGVGVEFLSDMFGYQIFLCVDSQSRRKFSF